MATETVPNGADHGVEHGALASAAACEIDALAEACTLVIGMNSTDLAIRGITTRLRELNSVVLSIVSGEDRDLTEMEVIVYGKAQEHDEEEANHV
jgi:hypothetical protein